ncbi:hypothetical protein AB0E96_09520 [Kitasatospora sp. NPDC036755]|uniref:hypothetical protein n=1 Tax=Kitasatospora sp. NPDC036755 TaxID=3154600 RepID=UPI00340DA1A8
MTENQITGSEVEFVVQAEIINGGIHVAKTVDPNNQLRGVYRQVYVATRRVVEHLPEDESKEAPREQLTILQSEITKLQEELGTLEADVMLFAPVDTGKAFWGLRWAVRIAVLSAEIALSHPESAPWLTRTRGNLDFTLHEFAQSIPRNQ